MGPRLDGTRRRRTTSLLVNEYDRTRPVQVVHPAQAFQEAEKAPERSI